MASGSARQRPTRSGFESVWDVDSGERGQRPRAAGGAIEWGVGGEEGWPDRRIGQIASRQKSLITREQLMALGVGRDVIDRALARGRLHSRHRSIYSMVPFPVLPPLAIELAAVLACGESALLSHHSAAGIWGLRPAFNGDVHVTVIGKETGRRP